MKHYWVLVILGALCLCVAPSFSSTSDANEFQQVQTTPAKCRTSKNRSSRTNPSKTGPSKPLRKVDPWMPDSIARFSFSLLRHIDESVNSNVVLSPLSVWTVLAMLLEASDREDGIQLNTQQELKNVLWFDKNLPDLRRNFKNLQNIINGYSSDDVSISAVNLLANSEEKRSTSDIKKIYKNNYNSEFFEFDSNEPQCSVNEINNWLAEQTKQRITNLISTEDVGASQLLLASTVFFRGRWMFPFVNTTDDVFKNENDAEIGKAKMMKQKLNLPYAYNPMLQSRILKIPYANENVSMIVILPRKKIQVSDVLKIMSESNMTLSHILRDLNSKEDLDEIDLGMPRFTIKNNFNLNAILSKKMGLVNAFSTEQDNFPKLGKDIYVSKIIHEAEIENTEEGTTASAATVAHLVFKGAIVEFHANRPFIFIINDNKSGAILFLGVIRNTNF